MMGDVLLAAGCLILGAVASGVISRHYFIRSTKRRLTPYIHLASRVLAGVDPAVREALQVQYAGVKVKDLYHVQFLIANDGEIAISQYIEPLQLKVPADIKLLDAIIIHAHPEGRRVSMSRHIARDNSTSIIFNFALLNRGDFFIVKLLLDGFRKAHEFEFSIAADGLPSRLEPQWLDVEALDSGRRTLTDWLMAFAGVLTVGIGLGMGILFVAALNGDNRDANGELIFDSRTSFVMTGLMCLLVGLGFWIIAKSLQISPRRRVRFDLPNPLRRQWLRHDVRGLELLFGIDPDEPEAGQRHGGQGGGSQTV